MLPLLSVSWTRTFFSFVLRGATLGGVDLSETNLRETNLKDAINLDTAIVTIEQLAKAKNAPNIEIINSRDY
jgi:uncharacterized protein YjbI with pentapeptide repeats